jgi:hypothetical protein
MFLTLKATKPVEEPARRKAMTQLETLFRFTHEMTYEAVIVLLDSLPVMAEFSYNLRRDAHKTTRGYEMMRVHSVGHNLVMDMLLEEDQMLVEENLPWTCVHGLVTSCRTPYVTYYMLCQISETGLPLYLCIPRTEANSEFEWKSSYANAWLKTAKWQEDARQAILASRIKIGEFNLPRVDHLIPTYSLDFFAFMFSVTDLKAARAMICEELKQTLRTSTLMLFKRLGEEAVRVDSKRMRM